MILFCWEIKLKKLKKKKSAKERCDTRGMQKEHMENKKKVTEELKRKYGWH